MLLSVFRVKAGLYPRYKIPQLKMPNTNISMRICTRETIHLANNFQGGFSRVRSTSCSLIHSDWLSESKVYKANLVMHRKPMCIDTEVFNYLLCQHSKYVKKRQKICSTD